MKAIILAGGKGTRLRPVIGDDTPKCLAPVMGTPMIEMVIKRMKNQGIRDITLALGYKAEMFAEKYGHMKCKVESEPLGTGGAILNCLTLDDIETNNPVIIANGDTFVPINYNEILTHHSREVTVSVDKEGHHAGVYIVNPIIFRKMKKKSFSFENELLPLCSFSFFPVPWFNDFGTPAGYAATVKDWV